MVLMLVGCQDRVRVSNPLPHTFDKDDFKNNRTVYVIHPGDNDSDLLFMFYVIANEGKKYGAKYFTMLYSNGLNNYLGSPITSVDEMLRYCEQDLLGNRRPRCSELYINATATVHYLANNDDPNILVWSIDETLNDPQVKRASEEYKLPDRIIKK
jgi:hypothetical protein